MPFCYFSAECAQEGRSRISELGVRCASRSTPKTHSRIPRNNNAVKCHFAESLRSAKTRPGVFYRFLSTLSPRKTHAIFPHVFFLHPTALTLWSSLIKSVVASAVEKTNVSLFYARAKSIEGKNISFHKRGW